MKIFVTGASGFIGSAVVTELIGAGHKVVGLVRSDEGAHKLAAAGAEVFRGDVNDLENLRKGVSKSDGVIHTAFNHDFSKFMQNCEDDRRVVEAIGLELVGSDRPFLVTSGTAIAHVEPGKFATEDTSAGTAHPRAASEKMADALVAKGVRAAVMRLSQIHNTEKQGLITYLITLAREKSVSAYVGDGLNNWSAAHILDTARLYRLAIEKLEPGMKYHAVAEEAIAMRDVAEVIGKGLKFPVAAIPAGDAAAHFGWLSMFAGLDLAASSAKTRALLGWKPSGPGLISDLEGMFANA